MILAMVPGRRSIRSNIDTAALVVVADVGPFGERSAVVIAIAAAGTGAAVASACGFTIEEIQGTPTLGNAGVPVSKRAGRSQRARITSGWVVAQVRQSRQLSVAANSLTFNDHTMMVPGSANFYPASIVMPAPTIVVADIPASMEAIIPAIPIVSISATPIITVVMSVVIPAIVGFDRNTGGLSHCTRNGQSTDSKNRR